jgi:hypothetical protein
MDRRKDTPFTGTKLPRDYTKLIEDVFNKNFSKFLTIEKGAKEKFISYGEVYPDELVLAISLKNPTTLRMTTCYASVDYPPKQAAAKAEPSASVSEAVQISVNRCVDATASFFNTFFEDGRPVDYDMEYRQDWTPIEIDKNVTVHVRINRDNPELEEQADELLAKDEDTKRKRNLH